MGPADEGTLQTSSPAERLLTAFRQHTRRLPGLRSLAIPKQLASKRWKTRKRWSLAMNLVFESDWLRYGRITMLDAGSSAQLCCGALYPDCVTDAPPLVFDVILLDDRWLLTLDFVPLFLDSKYEASYISPLKEVRARHKRIMPQLPNAFYDGKRWTSKGLLFASSNMLRKGSAAASSTADDMFWSFDDALRQYVNLIEWAIGEGHTRSVNDDVLVAHMSHLAWLWKQTHPSHLLLEKYMGQGWAKLVKDTLWRDTHGLDRWGALTTDEHPSYSDVYSNELEAARGDVKVANKRLESLGLLPLEYIYLKPDPSMLDINKDIE